MEEKDKHLAALLSNRSKWGFIWIIISSTLWGLSYVPKEVIWYIEPLSPMWETGGVTLLEGTVVASALQALFFGTFIFLLWSLINGKQREAVETFVTWPISKWFFASAIFGGLMAMFGSTLATAYVGADYAATIALLSATAGTLYGRAFLKEKLTPTSVLGMIVMTIGGILVIDPVAMINEMSDPSGKDGLIFGYVGGILSAIGWGVESCYNVRGLEMSDNEATTPSRYMWECIIWLTIIMPLICLFVGISEGVDVLYGTLWACLMSPAMWVLTLITVFSLGIADSLLHKGYILLGAGRGLAMNAIYAPISLLALWVFLKDYDISFWLIVGSFICIVGTFIIYWHKEEFDESVRDFKDDPSFEQPPSHYTYSDDVSDGSEIHVK